MLLIYQVSMIEAYLRANKMFVDYNEVMFPQLLLIGMYIWMVSSI